MDRPRLDKATIDETAWTEAVAREAVIRPLASAERVTPSDIAQACRTLGLKRTRLYELIGGFRANPVTSALLPRPRGIREGTRLLSDAVERAIEEAVTAFYRSRQKPTAHALHKHLQRVCRQRGIPPPCWQAIRARLDSIDPGELMADREGAKKAHDRYKPVPGEYRADHAFEVVQIDHTLVDLIVVDTRFRRPIQRPWLTLAIDVASRMVAGFHLTLEPPSATSVALAIQHMVAPKTAWLAGRDVTGSWPVAGLPDAIHVDNAKEFRSRALQRGAEEYGIALIHRPVATPHFGGHIERLIGTMMGAVHLLPGTTFSAVAERGDYASEQRADPGRTRALARPRDRRTLSRRAPRHAGTAARGGLA